MRPKRQIMRWIILITGMSFLFSVIVSHHHHDGGKACFVSFFENIADASCCNTSADDAESAASHPNPVQTCNDCSATLSVSVVKSASGLMDVTSMLLPLFLWSDVFDVSRLRPVSSFILQTYFPAYIEALRHLWVVRASGLRAPPVF